MKLVGDHRIGGAHSRIEPPSTPLLPGLLIPVPQLPLCLQRDVEGSRAACLCRIFEKRAKVGCTGKNLVGAIGMKKCQNELGDLVHDKHTHLMCSPEGRGASSDRVRGLFEVSLQQSGSINISAHSALVSLRLCFCQCR